MKPSEINFEGIPGGVKDNSTEKKIAKDSQKILDELETNTDEENRGLAYVKKMLDKSAPNFQKEDEHRGIFMELIGKMRKNRLIHAALVGLSLYSANPAFASNLDTAFRETSSINSDALNSFPISTKNLSNASAFHTEELRQIYMAAPEEKRKIILDELENGNGLSDEIRLNSKEDLSLLCLQQQLIDLQNEGELENNGKRKMSVRNATENQIRDLVDYLKNPYEYVEKQAAWDQKNKQGWQDIYPKRNEIGYAIRDNDYDTIENL